jgi:hypothetical protein
MSPSLTVEARQGRRLLAFEFPSALEAQARAEVRRLRRQRRGFRVTIITADQGGDHVDR